MIGMETCARAVPDGYTLCITSTSPISQHPWLVAHLPYDPPRDFAPIIEIGVQPGALVVNPAVPVSSVQELFALAREKPDTIGWASSGTGSPGHLYYEWLKSENIRFYHVPYKTLNQALIGTINGDVQVLVHSLAAVMPQVKAGKLKLLAAGMDKRTAALPDVPSAREAGLEAASSLWIGAFAPSRTPRDIIVRLNEDMQKVLASADGRRALGARGVEPVGGSPEQFAEFLKADRELTGRLVKLAGMKPQ
jgi:tripartite-type tricarboxylate transporter receptor subunit TctC